MQHSPPDPSREPTSVGDSQSRATHDELDNKIMRGSAFGIVGFGGANILSLVMGIVLARLLTPSEFGLVALALSILAVTHIVQESGLHASLIVYLGDMRRAAASAFVFTPFMGAALYAACFLAAPYFADFFDEPALTDILRVTAIIVPLRALMIVPGALLERAMQFGRIAVIEITAGVVQASTTIPLALAGAGAWSLVAGQVAMAVVQLILVWAFAPMRPSVRNARFAVLRELLRYGRHVGAANVIMYGTASAEGMVVGRQLGTASLGNFSVAGRFASMPVTVLGNIVGRGVFAAMARLQDDLAACRRIWLENLQRLALVAIPAAIGLTFVAEPFVIGVLGEKWRLAVVPLQILAINGIVRTFSGTQHEVFQARLRPHYRSISSAAYLVLVVPALVIGASQWGLNGAAGAIVVSNAIVGVPVVVVMMRLLEVDVRQFATAISRPVIGWAIMSLVLVLTRSLVAGMPSLEQLLILVLAGSISYALATAVFARTIVVTMWRGLRGVGVPGSIEHVDRA